MPGNSTLLMTEFYADHVAEMQRRWEASMEAESVDSLWVHSGSPIISFQDDFEYAFRPNPNFLAWLPLTHHHDSVLQIRPGQKPRLFYYQPDDYWYLPPSDPESWWADLFDITVTRSTDEWRAAVGQGAGEAVLGDAAVLDEAFGEGKINPAGLAHRLHIHRTRKTPYEIACMQEATRLGAIAHRAAEKAFREGCSEFEIHQRYLAASGHADSELPYHNIVALNTHGAVLHYQGRDKQVPEDSRSFLIDAGCTCHAYASDITRTYAREEGEFAELIQAMDGMQQSLIEPIKAGDDYCDLHLQAHHYIAGILQDFGVINCGVDEAVETGLSGVFYPHGLGHFIGLQTHDVAGLVDNDGNDLPRPEGHPFLRLTRTLESTNVLTIEPGLYFIEPLLRRWKEQGDANAINWYKVESLAPYGGVRIEDNIVIHEHGNDNLTREAFRSIQ